MGELNPAMLGVVFSDILPEMQHAEVSQLDLAAMKTGLIAGTAAIDVGLGTLLLYSLKWNPGLWRSPRLPQAVYRQLPSALLGLQVPPKAVLLATLIICVGIGVGMGVTKAVQEGLLLPSFISNKGFENLALYRGLSTYLENPAD